MLLPFYSGPLPYSTTQLSQPLLKAITSPTKVARSQIEKNSSALFTTEIRSTRRGAENPDASVPFESPWCERTSCRCKVTV